MVQATDDVYDRTKKLMKEAEEQRKEARYETKLVCFLLVTFISPIFPELKKSSYLLQRVRTGVHNIVPACLQQ